MYNPNNPTQTVHYVKVFGYLCNRNSRSLISQNKPTEDKTIGHTEGTIDSLTEDRIFKDFRRRKYDNIRLGQTGM